MAPVDCVDPPASLLSQIQRVWFFLHRLHWVPQSVLFFTKEEGGQGLVHLASRGTRFCLQFIQGLLCWTLKSWQLHLCWPFIGVCFQVWTLLKRQWQKQTDSLFGLPQLGWPHSVQAASHCMSFYSGTGGGAGWTILLDWLLGWEWDLHDLWISYWSWRHQCSLLNDFRDGALLPNCTDPYPAIVFPDFKNFS